jgi:ABC-type uncharacterized transport system permease subunit
VIGASLEYLLPLLLAALGGLYSERAGVLNISLEGSMLMGAFFSVVLVGSGMPWIPAAVIAMVIALIPATLMAVLTLAAGANLFIVGLGTNLLGFAITATLSEAIFGTKGVVVLDPGSGGYLILLALGIGLVPVTWWILHRTGFGLSLRAAGEHPEALRSRGRDPRWYRGIALLISSGMAALAGSFLAYRLDAWVPNMSAGRGWIALALIYVGRRSPWGVLIAALAFSLAENLTFALQGIFPVPGTLFLAMPYLLTLVSLFVASIVYRKP